MNRSITSRTIRYVDPDEDILQEEVELALTTTMEENLCTYCQLVVANFAMAGIDIVSYPLERTIAYADE